jgi:hypothetical protein
VSLDGLGEPGCRLRVAGRALNDDHKLDLASVHHNAHIGFNRRLTTLPHRSSSPSQPRLWPVCIGPDKGQAPRSTA